MADAADTAERASRSWLLVLGRAIVAAAAGCVVTFSPDHSPSLGLAVFGGFALLSGAASLALGLRSAGTARTPALVAAGVTLLAGVLALVALPVPSLLLLIALVSGWGLVSGTFELVSGRRGSGLAARDAVVVGAGTLLLGAVFAVLPPHPVVSVGLLGAYAVMVGVYLAIAALSLKWAGASDAVAPSTPTTGGDR